jgi:hypothetical protein
MKTARRISLSIRQGAPGIKARQSAYTSMNTLLWRWEDAAFPRVDPGALPHGGHPRAGWYDPGTDSIWR